MTDLDQPMWEVTTKVTAYTTYLVRADNQFKAEEVWEATKGKGSIDFWEDGYGDDEKVLVVRRY